MAGEIVTSSRLPIRTLTKPSMVTKPAVPERMGEAVVGLPHTEWSQST